MNKYLYCSFYGRFFAVAGISPEGCVVCCAAAEQWRAIFEQIGVLGEMVIPSMAVRMPREHRAVMKCSGLNARISPQSRNQ
jgi:hypothetical protein